MERKKKQRKFGYIKICLYICNRWLVKTHTGGRHQKVRSFFHIYGKDFLGSPAPLRGNLLKKKKKQKKDLDISKLVCIFAM